MGRGLHVVLGPRLDRVQRVERLPDPARARLDVGGHVVQERVQVGRRAVTGWGDARARSGPPRPGRPAPASEQPARGAFWTGHRPSGSGHTAGRCGSGWPWAQPRFARSADEGGPRGQLRLGDRPVDALHDAVVGVQEEGRGQSRQIVGDDVLPIGAGRWRPGRSRPVLRANASADEAESLTSMPMTATRPCGSVEPGDQRRLPLAGRAPGGEEVHDERAGQRAERDLLPGWPSAPRLKFLAGVGGAMRPAAGAGEPGSRSRPPPPGPP